MNKEAKTKWLEALRSGKYQQGQGRLRTHDAFCCLGVLCDVVQPEGWKRTAERGVTAAQGGRWKFVEPGNAREGELPPRLANSLGLRDHQTALIGLNDTEGLDFNQIAQWIEENL